ncbi:HsdR family type I site-specific deoxyribonuclease [Roseivirga sp.]|uniref:type I restriction endonuclease subunit R n=1 Tax=Roseivirga sp. TaxID=1964215 RepID=UPI0023566C00|nr:HsdR family type I site-specific deoxyribonuclease [Roseivirga sp.]
MMKFTEAQLEQAFIRLLAEQSIDYEPGNSVRERSPNVREPQEAYGLKASDEVLIKDDLRDYLFRQYSADQITEQEVEQVIRDLEKFPASDLYESNKAIMKMVSDGFLLKREDRTKKDLFIRLIDYSTVDANVYRCVNQLAIQGFEIRIPDLIIYINGIPLVVFEFKSAIREETALHNAYEQLTIRYKRDIPELFKYNAFCVISDGANSKAGTVFGKYDFYYAWKRVEGMEQAVDGINSMHTMVQGMLNRDSLRDIIHNFIYFPDTTKKEEKIICRYPQYYAAKKLLANVRAERKPNGSGKGGTYFGTTGCGKSYTMLFLTRLLMRDKEFASPTIVLITDRTDLDDQLGGQFTNAKSYIGDNIVESVLSRAHLREMLQGRNSGGVFLTTIHKFTEDTELLTERSNVICISDEAHRSQVNLDQKVRVTADGVTRTFGFAKYLHDSLPNATYVGFTGTPIDATMSVFGEIVDAYTMTESVRDEITVRIVYEGRAAKVVLNNSKLKEIEEYYAQCAQEGTNEYQIEESKKASANINSILGDPDRLEALAKDFVEHYETRVKEGSTVKGKAMFVSSNRRIAYDFYKELIKLRPEWGEVKASEEGAVLTDKERKELMPIERVKMVMTRDKDDPNELYELLGTKENKKELDRQFKNEKSNFKIAIVVDMWLTGFDVPFLDTIYIDKPIQRHSLIQTISRVNRKFTGKNKGLVVDYIGIKKQMNMALAQYGKVDDQNFEDIDASVVVVKDHLDLLAKLFHHFDSKPYFTGDSLAQLNTLNKASEFVQSTQALERRFMNLVKRMKAAYDICSGSEKISQVERDTVHFYLAVRSIVFKLTKGEAPDIAQMNAKVREMIKDALQSDGVEEILKLGEDSEGEIDLFDDSYLAKIDKIKLPNTKIKLLQKLLAQAIDQLRKVNRMKGVDFSQKMEDLVKKYNEREPDTLTSDVLEDFADEIVKIYYDLRSEMKSHEDLGINFEEKAFYDILKELARKYDFQYPDDKLKILASSVKTVVDDKARYTDWSKREDIKAELKVDLIILLAEHDYPPVDRDEVYKEIFEQAENFKRNR